MEKASTLPVKRLGWLSVWLTLVVRHMEKASTLPVRRLGWLSVWLTLVVRHMEKASTLPVRWLLSIFMLLFAHSLLGAGFKAQR